MKSVKSLDSRCQKLVGFFRTTESGVGRIVQGYIGRSSAVVGIVGSKAGHKLRCAVFIRDRGESW